MNSQFTSRNGQIINRDAAAAAETRRVNRLGKRAALLEKAGTLYEMLPDAYAPVTEFEIQVYLMNELQRLGFHVRGELRTRCHTSRFDLIVYRKKEPIRIIEVKRHRRGYKECKASKTQHRIDAAPEETLTKQLQKYEQYGIPVDLVGSMEGATAYIQEVEAVGFPDIPARLSPPKKNRKRQRPAVKAAAPAPTATPVRQHKMRCAGGPHNGNVFWIPRIPTSGLVSVYHPQQGWLVYQTSHTGMAPFRGYAVDQASGDSGAFSATPIKVS